jgi:hypothetical protein
MDQTLRGLIHEPNLSLSILTEAYIHVCQVHLSGGKLKVIFSYSEILFASDLFVCLILYADLVNKKIIKSYCFSIFPNSNSSSKGNRFHYFFVNPNIRMDSESNRFIP